MNQSTGLQPSLNEAEETTHQLQKLKGWLHSSTMAIPEEPIHTTTETDYDEKLKQGIAIRKKHLNIAKDVLMEQQLRLQREFELDGTSYGVKERMNGLYYTNDRVPYHVERGDSIGVSLGAVKMHGQVQQSEEYLMVLESRLAALRESVGVQVQYKNKLEALVRLLKERVANATDDTVVKESQVQRMERLVEEEMLRTKKLKGYLKEMRREYE